MARGRARRGGLRRRPPPSGNLVLVGAAGVAGAHWGALYAAGVPLGALVVSHAAWDLWIFLVRPTGEITPLGRLGGSASAG